MGNLWFCGNGTGLFCQSLDLRGTDIFINYSHDPKNSNSLGSNNVWKIYEDKQANLWIATYHGLNKYIRETDSFERIKFEANPGSNFICDLVEDDKGCFWMTTDNGLIKFKIPPGNKNGNEPNEIIHFLPFRDIFPYKISMLNDGKICVGAKYSSENGYFAFYPDSIKDNERIPPLVITDFQIRNQKVQLDTSIILMKHIILHHDENFFSFEIATLDYFDPDENKYAYYIEGFEDDWIYSGTNRNARYTSVPPGEYIFRAKGATHDGFWNERGVAIKLSILPPPWKTWWAYTLYGLFLIGLIMAWRRYDLKRQRLKQELAIEHVEAEKLKELDSLKSRFFANISHEFRTPLTLILGPLQKVFSKTLDEETKQELNIMQRNARRLQQLINQLLTLSKLESGKLKLQADKRNVISLINGYVQSFESLAKQKGITLVFTSERDDIPAWIDQDKVEKILFNLLSNAFKFTESGGRIEVSVFRSSGTQVYRSAGTRRPADLPTRRPPEPNKYLEIIISDTGAGIPQTNLPYIFDRFYQVDDSYTKDGEGTGIGLALAKELVELHHGRIEVESEVGVGSTFRVYLPLGKEHLKAEEIRESGIGKRETGEEADSLQLTVDSRQTAVGNTSKIDNRKLTIDNPIVLIVEDNADLRLYIRGYLDQTYQVIEASDGKQGLEQAIKHIPDLIISDVMMPKMDGYELCNKLKADERTSHIPIILLTARAGTESKIEGLETGADDFITKPFETDELLVRIKNLIDLRKKLQERFMRNIRKLGLGHLMDLETPDLTNMDQHFLQKAVTLVLENIADPDLNVEKLGSELSLSRRQLHRKLVAITGDNPNKFIRSIRLNRAAELLRSKTGNVTEIAFEVGFTNLSWFSKCFKEAFGVLPSEYSTL